MSTPLSRRPLSPVSAVYLIGRREFVTRVRSRVFIIGTILVLVALAGYLVFQVLVLNKQTANKTYKVAYFGEAQTLAAPFAAASKTLDITIERSQVSGQTQAESQIRKGSLDLVISGSATSPQVLVRDQLNSTLQSVLQAIVRQVALEGQLSAAGLNPATVEANLASATVHVQALKAVSGQRIQLVTAGFIVALFLYVAILTFGQLIAQGVVEEKANRIVEILLSTVRPAQLLLGKVIGVGLVGLFQFAIIGVFALIATTVAGVFTVPTAGVGVILAGLLWFVLGYFLYAILFAAAGSLVSRQEDVASAALPITMLAVISWLIAIGVLTPMFDGSPMSTTGIALGFIPFFAPVILPTGMATGDFALWQVLLAIAVTIVFSAAATWLAARIYSNSVLRIGARVKLTDALRAR